MTLIECFTDSHMDNIAVCLGLRPEKLLLVGEKEAMRQPAEKYHDLLRQRGIATKIVLSAAYLKNTWRRKRNASWI